MGYIKNIEHDAVLDLASEIEVKPGQIISKTLVQNEAVSITLFGFSKGEEISTHDSSGDALVYVIEGHGMFKVGEKEHHVHSGEVLVMPATIPHSVHAEDDFKMLLTVVFPS